MHEYINSLLTPHCPGNLELTIPRAKAEDSPRQRGRQFGPSKGTEILYSVPGKTACYECFASYKEEREIPFG